MDESFEHDLKESILNTCVEREWPLEAVPLAQCVQELGANFEELAVRHCVRCLSTSMHTSWDEWLATANATTLALDPRALCRFKAQQLLQQCEIWPEDAFLEAWADALHSGLESQPSDLDGLAVVFEENGRNLRALNADALPPQPAARFASLWAVKPVWSLSELKAYISPILEPGVSLQQLVQKHARAVSAADGSVTYVQR